MSQKMLNVLCFVPVLNLILIVYFFITGLEKDKKQSVIMMSLWIGFMAFCTVFRSIFTMIFLNTRYEVMIFSLTYITLYLSMTAGALMFFIHQKKYR